MSFGNQQDPAALNGQLSSMSIQLRQIMQALKNYTEWFNQLGITNVETLFSLDSTDAATVSTLVNYMTALQEIYYGQLQQGGTGGTGAAEFDFDNALAILWGGQ